MLLALQGLLNGGIAGDYRYVYANVEAGQAGRQDTQWGMRTILGEMASRARFTLGDDFVKRSVQGGGHLLMGGANAGRWHLFPECDAVLIGTQGRTFDWLTAVFGRPNVKLGAKSS